MNITTEPVRDRDMLKGIFAYLSGKYEMDFKKKSEIDYRNYVMAKVQVNTALRISDVLKLKVSDFLQQDFRFKPYISLVEIKTGKEKKIAINKALTKCVKGYILECDLSLDDYLFRSKKDKSKPITTTQAHRIYQNVGKALNLENFASHSLRKTWGFYAYKESKDLAVIMDVYNHTDIKDTLKYIGITQEDKDTLYNKIEF